MRFLNYWNRLEMLLLVFGLFFVLNCSKKSTNSGGTTPPPGNNVTIDDNFFNPSSKTVSVGTTITWTNNGGAVHTVTSITGNELGSGDIPARGGTYAHPFNTLGTFNYHCIHHAMNGSITVQ